MVNNEITAICLKRPWQSHPVKGALISCAKTGPSNVEKTQRCCDFFFTHWVQNFLAFLGLLQTQLLLEGKFHILFVLAVHGLTLSVTGLLNYLDSMQCSGK